MKTVILALLAIVVTQTVLLAGTTKRDKPLYNVKVEVAEVENRTLECKVRDHKVIVDQPKAFHADDKGPTPPEMLAIAYGSCITSTLQFIAMQKKLEIKNIKVTVEGTIDFSKAVGISDENRAGYQGLTVEISFDAPLTQKEKEELIAEVFEKGAVLDNVANNTKVQYKVAE